MAGKTSAAGVAVSAAQSAVEVDRGEGGGGGGFPCLCAFRLALLSPSRFRDILPHLSSAVSSASRAS